MGSEILKPNQLKYGQIGNILSKTILKSGQKHPDFEWSGFQIVGTRPDHLKTHFQKVRISNVTGFPMVGFQIPTVFIIYTINNLGVFINDVTQLGVRSEHFHKTM